MSRYKSANLNEGMSFENDFNSVTSSARRGRRKAKDTALDHKDDQTLENSTQSDNRALGNASIPVTNEVDKFRKNIRETDIKIKLFILETTQGFKDMSLQEKISQVLQRSDGKLQEFIFKTIGEEAIKTYEDLTNLLFNYCTGKGIENIKKFREEKWSEFLHRLRLEAEYRKVKEEEIIIKIRKLKAPSHLQSLFYTPSLKLEEIIKSIEEWEINNFYLTRKDKRRDKKDFKPQSKRELKCYKCGRVGHIKVNCRVNKNINNSLRENKSVASVREENISINGVRKYSLFDSGSSLNIITLGMLNSIPHDLNSIVNHKKSVLLLDDRKLTFRSKILLNIVYNGKSVQEWFFILEKSSFMVIIGNKLIENLKSVDNKIKNFPVTCKIITKGDDIVSWHRNIRNWRDKREFQELVDKMYKEGKIERSNSAWLNPVVLQRKASGKLRFCCDFRRLNDLVELDRFAIPNIEDIIQSLHNMRYFSVIDLSDGFFQVKLDEKDREKTTFLDSNQRPMQFTVMPQGFKNSPAIFQRGMNIILEGFIGKICFCYIDDIIIFGENKQKHDENFKTVVKRLKEFNLKINNEKLVCCQEEVNFLGYRVSLNKLKPTLDRAMGIRNYKIPTTKRKLRSFLGVINFDRSFVKDLSTKLKPFYKLLHGDKFKWEEYHTEEFNRIKELWAKNLELRIPERGKEFILETDASDVGLGAVLKQNNNCISYLSRVLTEAEQRYSTPEKEMLAIVWALEKLEFILLGEKFVIITDNEAITSIKTKKESSSKRINRWLEKLSLYDFKIIHRPGKKNIEADAMSRTCFYAGEINKQNKTVKEIEDQVLKLHEDLSHRKTIYNEIEKNKIQIRKKEVSRILKKCKVCNLTDKKYYKNKGFVVTSSPGERIAVDILEYKKGFRIITAIDYFSRKIYAKFIRRKSSSEVIKFLNIIYNDLKFELLVSDNGKEFKNKEVDTWCAERVIERKLCIPYFHEENGRIERANRTLRNALNKEDGRLKERLERAVNNYNKTYHRGIGMSPNDAFKPENFDEVLKRQKAYSKEFGSKNFANEFKIGNYVLFRNEIKESKADKEFVDGGKICRVLAPDKYEIEDKDGNLILKHESQLRIRGGV